MEPLYFLCTPTRMTMSEVAYAHVPSLFYSFLYDVKRFHYSATTALLPLSGSLIALSGPLNYQHIVREFPVRTTTTYKLAAPQCIALVLIKTNRLVFPINSPQRRPHTHTHTSIYTRWDNNRSGAVWVGMVRRCSASLKVPTGKHHVQWRHRLDQV